MTAKEDRRNKNYVKDMLKIGVNSDVTSNRDEKRNEDDDFIISLYLPFPIPSTECDMIESIIVKYVNG